VKKLLAVFGLLTIFLALASPALAWTPGQNYYVSENDMQNALETRFDSALCQGIPRFGHHALDGYNDEYIVFDCDTSLNGSYCQARIKAVKGSKPGYFKPKQVPFPKPSCF